MQIHEPDVIAQNNRPGAVTGPQLPHYCYWLMQQGFSIETQRAYKSRVKLFLSYLSEKNLSAPCFQQQEIWTEVVDQFKQYLINELGLVSRTVNAILTA